MQIGKKYLAVSEAYSFEDLDGSLVEFQERRREFEVLTKPDKVITDDGQHKIIENLPEHLKSEDWFWVRSLETGGKSWFNPLNYTISLL